MPETRVVVDYHEAAYLRRRLVDPRRVTQILLVATDSEPPIQGYATERVLPTSAWRSSNKECYDALGDLSKVEASTHIGKGVGLDGLVKLALTVAEAIVGGSAGKLRACVQFKAINKYPPDRDGPRQYSLLTIVDEENASKSEVHVLGGDELVPAFDLAGTPLVKIESDQASAGLSDEDLKAHLERNQSMWAIWGSLGVTELKCLRVDFQFCA